jgi:hypothetical protein
MCIPSASKEVIDNNTSVMAAAVAAVATPHQQQYPAVVAAVSQAPSSSTPANPTAVTVVGHGGVNNSTHGPALCHFRPAQQQQQLQPTSTFHEIVPYKLIPQQPCQSVLGIKAFLKRIRSPIDSSNDAIHIIEQPSPPTLHRNVKNQLSQTSTISTGALDSLPVTPTASTKAVQENPVTRATNVIKTQLTKTQIPSSTASSISTVTETPTVVKTTSVVSMDIKTENTIEPVTIHSAPAVANQTVTDEATTNSSSVPESKSSQSTQSSEQPTIATNKEAFNLHSAPVAFVPVAMAPQAGASQNLPPTVAFPPVGDDFILLDSSTNGAIYPPITPGLTASHVLMATPEEEEEEIEESVDEGLTPWCKPGKLYSMDVIG